MSRIGKSVLIFMTLTSAAAAGDLPPTFLDTVVALGGHVSPTGQSQSQSDPWFTAGTGFFYQKQIPDTTKARSPLFVGFLVTAGHVVSGWTSSYPKVPLNMRINVNGTNAPEEIAMAETSTSKADTGWFFNREGKDIAIHTVNLSYLQNLHSQISSFDDVNSAADTDQMRSLGAAVSDRVAVLGFPMNLAGIQRNYVIARFGSVARLSDLFDGAAPTFLIDCFVFPGNSGGPVVLLPDINTIVGTPAITRAVLVGVLDSYVPYRDEAVSVQTHEPRVIFEENSGLGDVIPMDAVDETISEAERLLPPEVLQPPGLPAARTQTALAPKP